MAGDDMAIVIGGVDCHAEVHHASALDGTGRRLGERAFPATQSGYEQLLAWLRGFGSITVVGAESTGPVDVMATTEVRELAQPARRKALNRKNPSTTMIRGPVTLV